MLGTQIRYDFVEHVGGRRAATKSRQRRIAVVSSVRHRGGDQLVLRAEVTVESTVRQSRPAHDLGNADLVDAALAKCGRRGVENPGARLRLVLRRPRH
jgi:hypothetical protein